MAIENELISKHSTHVFIDEFVTRIGVVIIAILMSSIFWINSVDDVLTFLVSKLIPCDISCANLYDPYAWTKLRWILAFLLSFIPLIPVFFYQIYKFLEPTLFLREKRYIIRIFASIVIVGALSVISTINFILPALFEIGHNSVIYANLEPNYDTILLLDFAINIIWFEILLFGYVSIVLCAGGLNLINMQNIGQWRWVLFSSLFFIIIFTTNFDNYGLQWLVIVSMIILLEGLIRSNSEKFSSNLAGLKPVLDSEFKERKLLFVDCMCSGILPTTPPLSISPVGEIQVFNLCESIIEREVLLDKIAYSEVTDIIISGCDGSPLPIEFRNACGVVGCDVSGLNFLDINNMRIKESQSNVNQKILLLSEFLDNMVPNVGSDWKLNEDLEIITHKFGNCVRSEQLVSNKK